MHFARLVEQASATRFLRPICLSQTWSITDLVATYLSLELTFPKKNCMKLRKSWAILGAPPPLDAPLEGFGSAG